MSDYYGILTTAGAAICAESVETGLPAEITSFVIGDGNGSVPQPDPAQTDLVNTVFTGELNSLTRDKTNPSILIAEAVLPAATGPFWIREMGIKTTDGTLVAVCSLPPQYKVSTEEGASGTMVIRMNVIFTEGASVTLIVDDSAVLATREYVDQHDENLEAEILAQLEAHIHSEEPHDVYKTAAQRDVGTGPGQIPDMSAFTLEGDENSWCAHHPSGFMIQGGKLPDYGSSPLELTFRVPFTTAVLWHNALGYQKHTTDNGGIAYYLMYVMDGVSLTGAEIGFLGYIDPESTQVKPSPSSLMGGKYMFMGY